ncbi:MAG: DUF4340 domain-containing protein [Planctomycetota bacterium]|jgi:hypothetical protein|nr:DUF4340 domain-containing protein [Planctomycetota bacterium]
MKSRHFVVMAAALLILLAAGWLLRRPSPRPAADLAGQAGLVRLPGPGFSSEKATGIVLSRPAPPVPGGDSGSPPSLELREVRLIREEGAWKVASSRGAPANAAKIGELLADLSALAGDLQAEGKSLHPELGVDEAGALRVEVEYGSGKPLVVYAGERAGGVYGESYVRLGGEDRVYRVDRDLRRTAGMFSAASPAPAARDWLDLTLIDLPAGELLRAKLEYPGGPGLVLAREAGEAGGPPGPWKLEAGGAGDKFKPERLDSWVSAASLVKAEDAADPALAGKAAAAESYSLVLSAAGRPDLALKVLVDEGRSLAEVSTRPGQLYLLSEGERNRIFPPAGEFFAEEPPPGEAEPSGEAEP